ncbi:hypothetical protein [Methanopyrus kandleri]|uniref:hypothetical protein n=1 Tax=Methanopyrus kandleri TaxID=2320 RepID=UPI0011E57F6E|nr:hypothetical protein [Methanopyrus kandleri]
MPTKVVDAHVVSLEREEVVDEKEEVDEGLSRGRDMLERIVRVVAMAILRGYSVEDVTRIVGKALSLKPVDKALELLEIVFSSEPRRMSETHASGRFYRRRKVADVEV